MEFSAASSVGYDPSTWPGSESTVLTWAKRSPQILSFSFVFLWQYRKENLSSVLLMKTVKMPLFQAINYGPFSLLSQKWLVNWENNVHFHHYTPGISWLKLTLRKGPLVFLKSGTLAVTEMLVWAWTFCMAPLKQNSPTDSPSLSATCRETDWLHSWSDRDWWRLPVGDAKSTVLSWGKSRCHVKLWAGIGRQESRMGTVRTVGEQDAVCWQAVIKRQTQYSH